MDLTEAIAKLPRVGERRKEVPTIMDGIEQVKPQKCVVVQVSKRGLWYRVRFTETGRCECYKVPKLRKGK